MNTNGNSRTGNRWSPSEEAKVLELVKNGKTREEIAIELERGVKGIYMRLQMIAVSLIERGVSEEEVRKITGLAPGDIELAILDASKKKEKKNNSKVLEEKLDQILELIKAMEVRLERIEEKK